MSYPELARRAEEAMSEQVWSYVEGGAGSEGTQRGNVTAFDRWGLVPRMLTGAAERDLSVTLFGTRLPTPLLLAPVGVIGICDEGGHGDLLTARAAAATGVPMIASTLMQDPMEDVAAELGGTPGWFQLYPPNDRELTESFVRRAEKAGFAALVVTLDTLTLGWRPRDLAIASFPQLRGLCLANYFTDPVFRAKLPAPPEDDPQAAAGLRALALGAAAVAVGRPYAYGLAVGGQAGIEHVIRCLLAEADLTMAIDGYPRGRDLRPDALRPVGR